MLRKDFEELSCAYQETFQPGDDKDYDYRWGEGYIKSQEFAADYWLSKFTEYRETLVKEVEVMRLPEIEIEPCDNCGEEGYGKSWYGKGKETGDNWGDRYYPTGSVVFCKECFAEHGDIGKEWNGEEIWKRSSDRPEFEEARLSHIRIKRKENVAVNAAITKIIEIIRGK